MTSQQAASLSTSKSFKFGTFDFTYGKKTENGLWGCDKCTVANHFKNTHVCTNCFQSISPFIAQEGDDKENIDQQLRNFFLNRKSKTLENLAKKYPEQAEKVEALRSELAKKEKEIVAQAKDIYNIHSNYRPPQQSSTGTRSPLGVRSISDRAAFKTGPSSNIASYNYQTPPNLSQVNIAVAAPVPLPSESYRGSSKDNLPSVAKPGSIPNANVQSTTSPADAIVPSPNLVESLDTASSQKTLQSHDSPTTTGGNAVGNSDSSGGAQRQLKEIAPSAEEDPFTTVQLERQNFSLKYRDMSVFQLVTKYTRMRNDAYQYKDQIREKVKALGVTKESFEQYKALTKSYILEGYCTLWKLILHCNSVNMLKTELAEKCPDINTRANEIIQKQKEAFKKDKTPPLGKPPKYKKISHYDLPSLAALIILRSSEENNDGYLYRARKSVVDKLQRDFVALIKDIFDDDEKPGESEKKKKKEKSIEGNSEAVASQVNGSNHAVEHTVEVDSATESDNNCDNDNDQEIEELLQREPRYDNDSDIDNVSDTASNPDSETADDDSDSGCILQYERLLNLVPSLKKDLGILKVLSFTNPSVKLQFTKASFNTLVANPSVKNPGPNVIICMIGLPTILYDILNAISLQAKSLKDLKAVVLLIPSKFRKIEEVKKFISSFKERLQKLARKDVYAELVELSYRASDKRKAVVLTTYKTGSEDLSTEVEASLVAAKERCSRVYGKESEHTIPGGVHSTRTSVVKLIIKYLIPSKLENQVIWEIGVGYPKFAFMLSAISKRPVLCNDLDPGEVIDNLVVANGNVSESPMDILPSNQSSIDTAVNISGKKHKLEEADETEPVSAVLNPHNRIRYDDED